MGGVNGSLLRRLVLVEERAPRPPAPVENPVHVQDFWEQVRTCAPESVWRYFCQVDAELAAELSSGSIITPDADAWLKQRHPAFDDVLEGLARAVRQPYGKPYVLPYVQGWVIQWATSRLGWAFAYERANGTRAVLYDQDVRDHAGLLLVGWTNRECNQHWADPWAFLEQWSLHGVRTHRFGVHPGERPSFGEAYAAIDCVSRPDPDTLAKAGLHDAELELLAAEEER